MVIQPGAHELGPDNATLRVKTGRHGAASAAGHDLEFEVTSWQATLDVGDSPGLELTADATSLQVIKGEGGMKALDDGDKADIRKSIDKEILKKQAIHFRSTDVVDNGSGLSVKGELELVGKKGPVAFDVSVAEDGTLTAGTTLKQTDFGMKPYSALFGALKVNDEVEVVVEGKVPTA